MNRPQPPKPPPCRVECGGCHRIMPETEFYAEPHGGDRCSQRAVRLAGVLVFGTPLVLLGLALAGNPSMPWNL